MAENAQRLIVLDYDGVIRTRGQNRLDFFQSVVKTFINPLIERGILNTKYKTNLETIHPSDMTLEPKEEGYFNFLESGILSDEQNGIWFSDILRYTEKTGTFPILYLVKLMFDLSEENLTIEKLGEIKNALNSTEVSINDSQMPPLPEPDIDVESVLALKNLGYRVSLLTIQNNPDFQLPESLQDVFEQVMIASAPDFFGGGSEQGKITLYRHRYPHEVPLVYVADQSYEAEVAQGIGATYFFQVTGDLPRYYGNEIPEDTATVETLADFVGQLSNSGLGHDREQA